MKAEKLIEIAKKQVAQRYGFEAGILGSEWDYAMQITHRKKLQIEMYETVLDLVASALERLTVSHPEGK